MISICLYVEHHALQPLLTSKEHIQEYPIGSRGPSWSYYSPIVVVTGRNKCMMTRMPMSRSVVETTLNSQFTSINKFSDAAASIYPQVGHCKGIICPNDHVLPKKSDCCTLLQKFLSQFHPAVTSAQTS
jgi:hypothetical protein